MRILRSGELNRCRTLEPLLRRRQAAQQAYEQAEQERLDAAAAQAAEVFRHTLATATLREAVRSGDPKLIEQAAARKLQANWRGKMAKRQMAAKLSEREEQRKIEAAAAADERLLTKMVAKKKRRSSAGLFGSAKVKESTKDEKAEATAIQKAMLNTSDWKVRNKGYLRLIKYVGKGTAGTPDKPNTEKYNLISSALEEENPVARGNVLEAVVVFVDNCEPINKHTLPWMLDITAKGFKRNAAIKGRIQLVQKALLLMMEVDRPGEFVIAMVSQALKENNVDPQPDDEEGKKDVKKTQLLLETVRKAIERFGIMSIQYDVPQLLPMIVKLANHRAKLVKDEAVRLMVSVTLRLGESTALSQILSKFALAQRKKIAEGIAESKILNETPLDFPPEERCANDPSGDEELSLEALAEIKIINNIRLSTP